MASSAQNKVSGNHWLCTQTRGDIEFEWTIEKFHQLPEQKKEAILSPYFPNNSTEKWRLQFYPQGEKEEDAGWISVFVEITSDKMVGIEIQCEITIFRLKRTLMTSKFTHKFDEILGWGCDKFLERSKLLVQDDPTDAITIRCKIKPLGTHVTSSSDREGSKRKFETLKFKVQKNGLSRDLRSVYENPTLTDFTVISGDKTFPAHKLILASRSPVFAAMFQHKGVTENVKNEVKIANIEPAVVEGLLEFIYTDAVSKIGELAHGLLAAAEQYGLGDLKELCEETLYETLNEDNAAKLLALADLHDARQLKKYVMQYITNHAEDVAKSEAFDSVDMSLELSKEIIRALAFSASGNSPNYRCDI